MTSSSPFASFFMAGFECATQRRGGDNLRLDLTVSTGHERLALQDYRQVVSHGLRTVRDGLRWHLIEQPHGRYDWSSWIAMLKAARLGGVQPIWDLCHYGWPDFIDLWSNTFIEHFAEFCEAAARLYREETDDVPLWCPMNEISFMSWSGDVGYFMPRAKGRGPELKRQLIRAAVAGARAVRSVDPRARLIWCEPLINVVWNGDPAIREAALNQNESQFEAFDMLAGRRDADLGGAPEFLDIVGLNYYPHNQWYANGGPTIPMGHHAYTDMRFLLAGVQQRYARPMIIAETGAERGARPAWLHYVCDEVRAAITEGADIQGMCLYPVTAYSGWDNDRYCDSGLLSAPDAFDERQAYKPLADELRRQQALFAAFDAERLQAEAEGEQPLRTAARAWSIPAAGPGRSRAAG